MARTKTAPSQPAPSVAPDFTISNHGSVCMVRPNTPESRQWVDENVHIEGWQWMGDAFACEPRSIDGLVARMEDSGFSVQF